MSDFTMDEDTPSDTAENYFKDKYLNETFNIDDLFLIKMKEDDEPILFTVIDINIIDNYFVLENIDDKENIYNVNYSPWDNDIILENENYSIYDMIKLKEIKKDISQIVEDYEIDTEIVDDKDKIYSTELLKDDLLSELIKAYNCYDDPHIIYKLTKRLNNIIDIQEKLKNPPKIKKNISWLIPITDDKIKLYNYPVDKETMQIFDDGHFLSNELNDEIESIMKGYPNYQTMINSHMKHHKPLLNNNSVGYNTNEYYGKFLRNCIQSETCYGANGNYSYDERNTGFPIKTSSLIINEKNEYLSEQVIRVPPPSLNIIGYLQEPINKHVYSFNEHILNHFNLSEKCLLEKLFTQKQVSKRKYIKNMKIINHLIDTDTLKIKPLEDVFISHTFNRKMNIKDLEKTLQRNLPTSEDIFKLLFSDIELSTKLINYKLIQRYLYKYDIQYSELSYQERKLILQLLRNNTKSYIQNYIRNVKRKLIKPLKINKKPTTIQDKIIVALDYILKLKNEHQKIALLTQFINIYTRKSDKLSEDSDYLYNKYTDKPMLCRHYLYYIQSKNENDIFQTMISLFGRPPEDGCIYCKKCGEYLCPEEESTFDGFDDNNNVMKSKEKITDNKNNEIKIKELLEKKEDLVKYIQLISDFIGVTFNDEDIYHLILLYDNMNNDELAELRYSIKNIAERDDHPIVQLKISKLKKGEKKEEKKKYKQDKLNILKDFQKYLKNTNKLLMLISLISIYIQTNLPAFQIKKSLLFEIMNFELLKINEKGAKYIIEKIRKICEKYSSDNFWNNCSELLNEKNTPIIQQFEKSLLYCCQSKFMKLKNRIQIYLDYLRSKKTLYYKQEWNNFKPLQNNSMIQKISEKLNETLDKQQLTKFYNSYKIENISLIRNVYSDDIIADILDVEQVSILNNQSFRHIFRYSVCCYGVTSVNIYLNLTFNRLLDTSEKSKEILDILKKNKWNESFKGFKQISFFDIRRNIIPELLELHNSKHNNLSSCYDNDKLCNHFIHNSINNFDLKMLNAFPKRHYSYKPPIVYPEKDFKTLSKDFIKKIFSIYGKDSLGLIKKVTNTENHLNKYLLNVYGDINDKRFEPEKISKLTENEDNYLLILEALRYNHKLPYNEIIHKKDKYSQDDYNYLDTLTLWSNYRFISYLNKIISDNDNNELYQKLLQSIESNVGLDIVFSDIISKTERNCIELSQYLAQSDEITDKQKRRFATIYKNYETSQKVIFKSEQINQILNMFFLDNEFHLDIVLNYMNDIQSIFTKIINKNKMIDKVPKEWGLTDNIKDIYLNDITNRPLYLHNKIFLNTKDNYQGFNLYTDYSIHILSLYNYIKHIFKDKEMIKGNRFSNYNERYSDIYSKYLLSELFNLIIEYIDGLKDERSDIANDANDLFLSLEVRDDNILLESIKICSQFLLDLITHLLLSHYDPSWLYICGKEMELMKGLSKQKEKEKQNLINELDSAGKDKDELFVKQELNKTGQSQYWKEASHKYLEFTKTEEHATMNENERKDRFKEIFGEISIDSEEINISIPNEEDNERLGYDYHEDKDIEDDEVDNLDEELDMEFNE